MTSYALRNLQVTSIEVIDYLRKNLEHGYQQSKDQNTNPPELRTGRWREVLDISHPTRPYNPYMALTAENEARLAEAKDELKRQGLSYASAAPESTNVVAAHFAMLSLKVDRDGARRIGFHESIGLLSSLADLTDTLSKSPDSTPGIRAVNQELNKSVKRLEELYLQSLREWMSIPPSQLDDVALARLALDFQNVGLLRARMRAEHGIGRSDTSSEKELLEAVDHQWETYHTLIKPAAWFGTLLRLPQAEIEVLSHTIADARNELAKVSPPYGEQTFIAGVTAAIGPLVKQFTTARECAPFLQKHREMLIGGGKYLTLAALTYTFNVFAPVVLGIGIHSSPSRHLYDHIQEQWANLKKDPRWSFFQQDVLQKAIEDSVKDSKKALLKDPAAKLAHQIARTFSFIFHRNKKPGSLPAMKLSQAQHQTLTHEIGTTASRLAHIGWIDFRKQNAEFLRQNGALLVALLDFDQTSKDVIDTIIRGRKSQTYLSTVSSSAYPPSPAFLTHSENNQRARALMEKLNKDAKNETALNTVAGFTPHYAPMAARFWKCRANLINLLAQTAWSTSTEENIAAHSRPLSQVQVRHDPSPLDRDLFAQVKREDKDAANTDSPLLGFAVGIRYHHSLPPSLHYHLAITKALFPGNETSVQKANNLVHLAHAGNLGSEIRQFIEALPAIPQSMPITALTGPTGPQL